MKTKQLIFGILMMASLSGFAQVLENSIVNHGNLIVTENVDKKIKLHFAESDNIPYCLIPYNYKRGGIILPQDRNGNIAPFSCKYITDADKKLTFDPKENFEDKKYDGVFLFRQSEVSAFNACLGGVDHELGYTVNDYCMKALKNIHSIAIRKKKRLNVSSKELYFSNINNSARDIQKDSVPYSPSNIGQSLSGGSQVIMY